MRELRTCRSLASIAAGLLCLLLLEVPALAYASGRTASAGAVSVGDTWTGAPSSADRFTRCSPLQLRRSMAVQRAADEAPAEPQGKWVPTMPEGAVFTAIGSGLILGGGIVLGVGMAGFFPIVLDAGGLITEANQPLILMGLGLTLLITGIAFLVHGVEVLKAVREAEAAAAATAEARLDAAARPWRDAWQAPAVATGASAGVSFAF